MGGIDAVRPIAALIAAAVAANLSALTPLRLQARREQDMILTNTRQTKPSRMLQVIR